MKIKAINEKGIEVLVDSKELVIGNGTIADLERDLIKLENMMERKDATSKRELARLTKIWGEIR